MQLIHATCSSLWLENLSKYLQRLTLYFYDHHYTFLQEIKSVSLVPSNCPVKEKCDPQLTKLAAMLQRLTARNHKSIIRQYVREHTISHCRKTQVFHSIFHKFSKLLSL